MQDLSARYTKIFDGEEIFILARIKQLPWPKVLRIGRTRII